MNKSLNQAVNDYLVPFELDAKQLASLQALKDKPARPISTRRFAFGRWVAAFAFIAVLYMGFNTYEQHKQTTMVLAIASEVTRNHAKLKPLEVRGSELEQVRKFFDKLDFLPSDTRITKQLSESLIGGRYCSIQGHTAAQLRIQLPNGRVSTLFETEYDPDTFDMLPHFEENPHPIVRYVNGYQVRLWVENGIVMAWVVPAPE